MVKVVVNGDHKFLEMHIAKEVVDPEDVEGLQDLILAALNHAMQQIDQTNQERINAITGGMNMKLPF